MIESAIESLARSGRTVRIRELTLGYVRPLPAAFSGAVAALLMTWVAYLWYPLLLLLSLLLRLTTGQTIDPGPPPDFHFFAVGQAATAAVLVEGAFLALIRRWSVCRGRFIVIDIGPIVQIRAGWHAPATAALFFANMLILSDWTNHVPQGFGYVTLTAGAIVSVIIWETLHDWVLPLFVNRRVRRRAVIELDLKEALAQDETAFHWRVEQLWFDPDARCAVLRGDFPDPKARSRAKEVALRVRGVEDVRLEQT